MMGRNLYANKPTYHQVSFLIPRGEKNMNILNLLATDNYTIVNKTIAKKIGIENSLLLGTLCSLQNSFKTKEFYRSENELIEDTCLTLYSLRKCKNELINLGILQVEKKGLPARHYFKLNENVILKLFSDDDKKTSGNETVTNSSNEIEISSSNENTTTSNYDFTTTTYNKHYNKQDSKQDNIKNICIKDEFEMLWKEYPNKQGKEKAFKSYVKVRTKEKVDLSDVVNGLKRYLIYCKQNKDWDSPKNGSTWFSQKCWEDEYEIKEITTKDIAPMMTFDKFR